MTITRRQTLKILYASQFLTKWVETISQNLECECTFFLCENEQFRSTSEIIKVWLVIVIGSIIISMLTTVICDLL